MLFLVFNSCKSDRNSKIANENDVPQRSELSQDSKIFLGNRLFSEKTGITCYAINAKKKTAPSVVEIMRIYKKNDACIVAFLKGYSKPIVDSSPKQIAIMQANIDGFLKKSHMRN